jgi:ATP-citrate lyase beta-subunit
MPRKKISEYRSKKIIAAALGIEYVGWSVNASLNASVVRGYDKYVIKVDQAVKGRFKKGLVLLDVPQKDVVSNLKKLSKVGYTSFIVEPKMEYAQQFERYISLAHGRGGHIFSVSRSGGVNIEEHPETIETFSADDATDWTEIAKKSGLSVKHLKALLQIFINNHFVFLEINPYIVTSDSPVILDAAVEVDDAGMYFTQAWDESDVRNPRMTTLHTAEEEVRHLDANSPASFNLSVLNPNGSIFLLLSGGGASVVIADEVYNVGLGTQLANYGEYSGNPNTHETYMYTCQVIQLALNSSATKKVVFIGGAVANFTDIANTFAGIIMALDEYHEKMAAQNIKIYVRRGGPRQEIGLAKIHAALEKYELLGGVYDPSTTITDALATALKGLEE